MTTSGLFSWLFKPAAVPEAVWNASTAAVQSQQPSSPEAPSAERTATGQDASHEKSMKLRGGGAGDICCGVCAGLLCFECCEDCC